MQILKNRCVLFFFVFFCIFFSLFSSATPAVRDVFRLPDHGDIHSACYSIYYADIDQIMLKINDTKNHLLSDGGHVIADKKMGRLCVYDDVFHRNAVAHFIHVFDVEKRQVFIKAVILLIDRDAVSQLGGYLESSEIAVPLIRIGYHNSLTIELSALEKNGQATVISEPELITLDRTMAVIASGDEIPYQEKTEQGNTNTAFKKAVLQLQVTPTILPNHKIHLALDIHQDKPSDLLVDGSPGITTQQIVTEVIVKNQQTIILGGIHERSYQKQDNKIPVLSRIPVIGWLFKNKHTEHKQQRLLIFITPSLVAP